MVQNHIFQQIRKRYASFSQLVFLFIFLSLFLSFLGILFSDSIYDLFFYSLVFYLTLLFLVFPDLIYPSEKNKKEVFFAAYVAFYFQILLFITFLYLLPMHPGWYPFLPYIVFIILSLSLFIFSILYIYFIS